jgi:cobaltochelatase CobN
MHLLAAVPGRVDDGEPVDPGQTPADIVFISAADSELAALAEARDAMESPPSLRLMSLMNLRHPMSVDLHLDACATKSRLVIARVLGGLGYWRHGAEQYAARLAEVGVPLALLPGDDKPDPELQSISTVSPEDYAALWAYLVEGGPANSAGFLSYAQAMFGGVERPLPAVPLLKAGLYWPGIGQSESGSIKANWQGRGIVPIIFYRSLLLGGGLDPINRLTKALLRQGLNPLPIFVASLRDPLSAETIRAIFAEAPPDVILNTTAFAVGDGDNPFAGNAPVLQVVMAATSAEVWADAAAGLSPRDIAMNVALPEVDGRILTRAIAFKAEASFDAATECAITAWAADGERCDFVAKLAANWVKLRQTSPADKRVALVLANYPNRDGRLANGVGLDTPEATVHVLNLLREAGYAVENAPETSAALMEMILAGPTNWLTDRTERQGGERLALTDYLTHYRDLPYALRQKIEDQWGKPEADPYLDRQAFALSVLRFGQVVVGVQPARGYNIDPEATYHSPDLVPPHHYLAFYFWLWHAFGAHAVVHMGKHGNLEWLPGKATALSPECWPEAVFGPTPHVYPFIVNDPGEGTQAKRRAQAVIIDHLTPPLTRAESYGPLRDLEALVDEYYEAQALDPRRAVYLRKQIRELAETTGIAKDAGLQGEDLTKLDAWLCELKEAQIRDGLHVFGRSPEGTLARDLAIALLRVPRGDGKAGNASLLRALAADLALGFDPLDCEMSLPWGGQRPVVLSGPDAWRTAGDTVERLELLSQRLIEGEAAPGPASALVLEQARQSVLPAISACGPAEGTGLLTALAGHFVAPGPSGAPTRGRPDVLPTGRNFYSVDSRAVPTRTAWELGWKSANLLIDRHLQTQGDWPRALLITAWGTSNMRTGGDDIAQALALMGVKPEWDAQNRRVTGFVILPLSTLGRPRVDVTLRVSGFFRDAFPEQMALVDAAARAVMALEEPDDENPAAARFRIEGPEGQYRVFGSKPGAYGAGLQALIDEKTWSNKAELGKSYLNWGSYAYGKGAEGMRTDAFAKRLSRVDGVVQNQDNREHDLLDSDDYYQFEGGASAAIESLQGRAPVIWHNDHSRPERPVIRTLEDEVARVIRSRVLNPKWIEGVKRHGYKGAFEIAATIDYMFAFAATTGAVKSHHFDLVYQTFVEDEANRMFIASANAPALREIAERLTEAMERSLWQPRSNSAKVMLEALRGFQP